MGGAVRPRSCMMKEEMVPLPAPGAPPSLVVAHRVNERSHKEGKRRDGGERLSDSMVQWRGKWLRHNSAHTTRGTETQTHTASSPPHAHSPDDFFREHHGCFSTSRVTQFAPHCSFGGWQEESSHTTHTVKNAITHKERESQTQD